jgi:cytochrome P450/NADPH-cytochrome P450 reductase
MNYLYYKEEQHRQENIVKIKELCKKIIADRTEHPKPDAKDLLNLMIHGVDRETGEKLNRENIEYQIPTFHGAGYETTSATLAFIYYFLCNNPHKLLKAQQEVDQVVGSKVLTFDMLSKLKYLDATIKEALRLQHPSSLLTRFAVKDTVLGGKYFIRKGQMVSGVWRQFHRDPKIWGEDSDEFRPERMLEENFQKLPPNSWKPVSTHILEATNIHLHEDDSSVTANECALVVVLLSKRCSSTWQWCCKSSISKK